MEMGMIFITHPLDKCHLFKFNLKAIMNMLSFP